MPLPPVNANVPNPVPVQPPVGGPQPGQGGVPHVAPEPVTRVGKKGYQLTGEIADTARTQGQSIFCETLLHAIARPGWFD